MFCHCGLLWVPPARRGPKICQNPSSKKKLVGGLEHECSFSILIGNFIIPTDVHSMIFQRGRSTTNQISVDHTHQAMLSTTLRFDGKNQDLSRHPIPQEAPGATCSAATGPSERGCSVAGPRRPSVASVAAAAADVRGSVEGVPRPPGGFFGRTFVLDQ